MRSLIVLLCAAALLAACTKKKSKGDGEGNAPAPGMDMGPMEMASVMMPPMDPDAMKRVMRPRPPLMRPMIEAEMPRRMRRSHMASALKPGRPMMDKLKSFSVPHPGEDWMCRQQGLEAQKLSLVKCRVKRGKSKIRGLFFVMFKGWVDTKPKMKLGKLLKENYKTSHARMFGPGKVLKEGPSKLGKHKAVMIKLAGQHRLLGPNLYEEHAVRKAGMIYSVAITGGTKKFQTYAPDVRKLLKDYKLLAKK